MLIRKAKLEDLESLGVLFDAYRKFYGKQGDIIGAGIFIKERLKNNDSEIFVAANEEDGVLMGFVQLYPLFSSTRMKRLWLLNEPLAAGKYPQRFAQSANRCVWKQREPPEEGLPAAHVFPRTRNSDRPRSPRCSTHPRVGISSASPSPNASSIRRTAVAKRSDE